MGRESEKEAKEVSLVKIHDREPARTVLKNTRPTSRSAHKDPGTNIKGQRDISLLPCVCLLGC